uniref:Myb-like domain-containing protein n=2 Tax=Scylla olivacea TaxID=85551 RepID=A0A0P4W805_SCYOL
MENCSYVCAECLQAFDSVNVFNKHECQINMINRQESSFPFEEDQALIKNSALASHPATTVTYIELTDGRKEELQDSISQNPIQTVQKQVGDETGSSGLADIRGSSFSKSADVELDENEPSKKNVKKRKKYVAMDESYRLNRTMRDKDFKLARSNFYSFKDTLGDWDERSTQLLIQLIHKYPLTYFLLPVKNERRMGHWEKLHKEMETAGYNFTILQLRMRWREVLQKYRWTVNYNDFHEIKKRCEYFDEMNELCGDWDKEATQALLRQMHRVKRENQGKKIVRIGYSGWEKITENLNMEGHKYTIQMVEGRWRNLVTLYKTMVDHNSIPNVELQTVAYKEDLEELVKYVPQRRNNYEKKVGRSVKMERFPSSGCRILLQAYKDCISLFMNPDIDNKIVWDEITQKLEDEGFSFATCKLKEILTGMIKGFEKCQHHNSLPGAIRRDVPYYRELAEVYGVYGRWPHIQISRTMEMRTKRKYRLRLQVSQQLWLFEESQALLQVYPDILEAHVNQYSSHQPSDLWLQVAKAYAATGHPKRDVPEIAVHVGLLRQGYAQNNRFPFIEEMRKVKETEEAVCYSPDVSKYTGEVEITYWSHEAVNLLLDLYIKYQSAATSSHASRNEVFSKIYDSMKDTGYKYTKDEISEQFKFLLTQYNTRKSNPWMLPRVGRQSHNPVGAPYVDKLQKILELRRQMSLSWTKGVKPLLPQAQKILLQVACQKAEELLIELATEREKKLLLGQIIDGVTVHLRTHQLIDPVPHTRQVRLHIADAIKNFDMTNENKDIARLYKLFKDFDMLGLICYLSLEPTNYDYRMESKKKPSLTYSVQNGNGSEIEEDSSNNINTGWILEEEFDAVKNQDKADEACEYLALAICHMSRVGQDHMTVVSKERNVKQENITGILSNTGTNSEHVNCLEILDSLDRNLVMKFDNASVLTSGKSLKPQHVGGMVTKNTENTPSFSKNICMNTSKRVCADGVYGKVFGKVHSAFPVSCIRQSNSMLYTISDESDSNFSLLLPKELTLNVESALANEKEFTKKQSKSRINKRLCPEDFMFTINDSEPDTVLKNEAMNSEGDEQSDSLSQNAEHNLKTKIIKTRSGRKTRFTFFSQTLNDDFDDSDLPCEDTNSPSKKIKLEFESDKSPLIKRKRGRPRKVSSESLALDNNVVDDITVVHSDSILHDKSFNPQEVRGFNLPFKMSTSSPDSILSLITGHITMKTQQQEKLLKMMKDHQREQSDILKEIGSIMDELCDKMKKTNK